MLTCASKPKPDENSPTPSGTRVSQRANFSLSVAETVVSAKAERRGFRKVSEKVRKNHSFLSKRVVFVVDDTGLEPVTSRTSTPKCDFL